MECSVLSFLKAEWKVSDIFWPMSCLFFDIQILITLWYFQTLLYFLFHDAHNTLGMFFFFQLYLTQAHYEQLYELSKSFFYNLEGIDEDYVSFILINKDFF